jgi:hypothetical protein
MDFIEWSNLVLKQLVELQNSTTEARQLGVTRDKLAEELYGSATPYQPGYWESSKRIGLLQATEELEKVDLVSVHQETFIKITPEGKQFISDPTILWTDYCLEQLDSDQSNFLKVINQLSACDKTDHAYLVTIESKNLLTELNWDDIEKASAIAQELGQQYDLLKWHGRNDSYTVQANYKGLVWDTRRGYTIESRHIDELVAEWETTSGSFAMHMYISSGM